MNLCYLMNSLQPVLTETADETQSMLLSDAKKKVGFIHNMFRNMLNLPAYLDTYLHGYDLYRS